MIEPYMAVALQTSVRHVTTRQEVERNLNHIGNMIDLVVHICSLELPVRLIALGEGAIQGFVDEILDMGQAEYTDKMAADMPGWETQALGEKAKQHGCYIIATLKTRNPKFPERFFNTVFMMDPNGEVCYQHQKNIVLHVEHSTTPHDVFDEWVAEHGNSLESFFPVAKTEIGNIGGTVGVEGAFPESYRAFAMNGAEILYRASLPEPWVSREIFEVQNRARAMALLQAKLLTSAQDKQASETAEQRRNLVGTGDRSDRIRTYNFPQGRMTDHRINLTLYKLDEVMEGDLDAVVGPLRQEYQADQLTALSES